MNKRHLVSRWLTILVMFMGLVLFFSGLFANLIGVDPNNGWGLRRIVVLEFGYLIVAISVVLLVHQKWKNRTVSWAILFTILQCLFIYFWYETAGTMRFITTTQYYDMQAQAYLHGQLALLQKPSPELLALPDPYDPVQNSPFRLHDATLFKGKYYLYWGPIPALILAGIKLATGQSFPDSFLVLLFMSGYIVFIALIMMELRRKNFPDSPTWILVLGVLIAGLMNPALWLLARPAIYEAAITGGQFFLLAGVFFALIAFRDENISAGKLALSGTLLACSVLSRISLVLGVFWVTVLVGFNILKRLKQLRHFLKPALAFSAPLIFGATMLFLYNYLRFGSPFEIGIKFTLGGMNTLKYFDNGSFHSPKYILPNLNTYFFFPTQKTSVFPFITAPWNVNYNSLEFIDATLNSPNSYLIIEPISGIVTTSPLLWFTLVPIFLNFIYAHPIKSIRSKQVNEPNQSYIIYNFHLFTGLALLTMLPVSLEFTATMRYAFDFNSSWYLLAFLGFMYGYTRFGKIAKSMLVVCFFVFGVITIVNGLLLGITSYEGYFQHHNPELFDKLLKFFLFS